MNSFHVHRFLQVSTQLLGSGCRPAGAYWHGLEQKQLTDRCYFYQNQKDKREQNIGGAKMRDVRQIWGEATL